MIIEQLRASYAGAYERLATAHAAIEAADTETTTKGDLEILEAELAEAVKEVERTQANLENRERVESLLADDTIVTETRRRGSDARVTRDELTYRPDDAARGRSFFSDAFKHSQGDTSASERITQHGQEMLVQMREAGVHYRDVGTPAFAGLTVPQYLIDLFAPLARAGAPTLAAVRKLPLPASGMTVNVSRITTGSAVAEQQAENDAVQETNIDDTLLTVDVRTYAGQQDVSRQALERSEMVDSVVYADLVEDYFAKVDSAILNGSGASGQHRGIRNTTGITAVTYTDATPTVGELYPKVADAIQQIASTRYAPATTIIMHPRRWGWATAALDSNGRPLVVPNAQGPFNAMAVGEAPTYGAVVGSMQGLPIITDANLPTNLGAGTEDVILVERVPDLLYWQEGDGNPRQLRFDQVAPPQSVRLAVWSYSAFTAGRYPAASATITGTGLIAPTF